VADFRVIFMGSGKFAVPVLQDLLNFERLLSAGKIVLALFSQPDRPYGREKKMATTPTKEIALKYKVPILEPVKLNEAWAKKIEGLHPDLIVVCDYGLLIPREILGIPKFGVINIHPSLLPKYRGSSPIQQAILDGCGKTGVSIILVDEKLDHGPVLAQKNEKIKNEDTFGSLRDRLAQISGRMLIDFLPNYLNGKFNPKDQNHKKATITRELSREDGEIKWSRQSDHIERMVRALTPWPGCYTRYNNKILKIIEIKKCKGCKNAKPGTVFLTKDKEVAINCNKGAVIIKKLQMEGKKIMTARDFSRGYRDFVGSVLR